MTFETFDQSDEETEPAKKKTMTNAETKTMTKTNTFREHLKRAILGTRDLWDICQSDEETWPDQKNDNDKDKYKDKDNDKDKYI